MEQNKTVLENLPTAKCDRDIHNIIIHCSATPPTADVGRAEIDRWHRTRGFTMIGYHLVIRRDGTIETGRPINNIGAHVEGMNRYSIGVCMVGGVDSSNKTENNFAEVQFESLKNIINILSKRFPKATILGHRDCPGVKTDCPSFDVATWLATTQTE